MFSPEQNWEQSLTNYCRAQFFYNKYKQLGVDAEKIAAKEVDLRASAASLIECFKTYFDAHIAAYDISVATYIRAAKMATCPYDNFLHCIFDNIKMDFWSKDAFAHYASDLPSLQSGLTFLGKTIEDYADYAVKMPETESALKRFCIDLAATSEGQAILDQLQIELANCLIPRHKIKMGLARYSALKTQANTILDASTYDLMSYVNLCINSLRRVPSSKSLLSESEATVLARFTQSNDTWNTFAQEVVDSLEE